MSHKKSSSKCDKEDQTRVEAFTTEERHAHYVQSGSVAWDKAWEILKTKDGWRDSTAAALTVGRVQYQNFPDIGRVFKLEGVVAMSPERLFEEVVGKVEENPNWNPTVLKSTIIERVNSNTDICHNITAEVAGGLVASRDFVSVRHWRTKDKVIMSAGVGVHHPDCAPSRKHVRGHNKPGGWFFAPSSEGADHCLFGWLMCTDLRGWLPQALIDKAIPKMLMDFVTHLNVHVSKERREGN